MKRQLFSILLTALSLSTASAQAPAFPGAEGHGRYATGGRGGQIVHVTNLKDDGSRGSLRWAVKSKNRIVVFDVAGVIALTKDLKIADNITIMGQTAPYPGITLRYRTIRPSNNNIIRFIRFRRGNERDKNDGADCTWQRRMKNIILDHCSMSWSIDELASFYDNNNFTMQWCMLGEALANAGHGKGAHSYGGIWGGKLASFHHNYLGFMQNRVPRFNGARYNWEGYTGNSEYNKYKWQNAVQAENVDFRNCVMYNWGTGGCYGGPGGGYINMVNNYYKAGPGTSHKNRVTQVSKSNSGNGGKNDTFYDMTSRYFIKGNYVYGYGANYDWKGVVFDGGVNIINGERYTFDGNHYYGQGNDTIKYVTDNDGKDYVRIKLDGPAVPTGEVTTQDAETAYDKVLAYAGASLYRDVIDKNFAEETEKGTTLFKGSNGTSQKGIIDNTSDDADAYNETTAGWGLTKSTVVDSDKDGIPDDWEEANGLDPHNASDANLYTIDSEKKWYTNVEVYCNSIVEDLVKAQNADAISAVDEYYPKFKTTTGIRNISTASDPVSVRYFNVNGMEVSPSYKGVVIKVTTLDNGQKTTEKIIW